MIGRWIWLAVSPKMGGYPDRYLNDVIFNCLKEYSHYYGAIKGEPFIVLHRRFKRLLLVVDITYGTMRMNHLSIVQDH